MLVSKCLSRWLTHVVRSASPALQFTARETLGETIANGVGLCYLVEHLGGFAAGEYTSGCELDSVLKIHLVRNVRQCFSMLENLGVDIHTSAPGVLNPNDIVSGDEEMAVGFVWSLFRHFVLQKVNYSGLAGSQALLEWVRDCIGHYPLCQNSLGSFSAPVFDNGVAWCCLLHHYCAADVSLSLMNAHNRAGNLGLVWDLFCDKYGLPKLFELSEFQSSDPTEQRPVVMVTALFYQTVQSCLRASPSALQVANVVRSFQRNSILKFNYIERASDLSNWLDSRIQEFAGQTVSHLNLPQLTAAKEQYQKYWREQRASAETLYQSWLILASEFAIERSAHSLSQVNGDEIPVSLSERTLAQKWKNLIGAELRYERNLNTRLARHHKADDMSRLYDTLASSVTLWVNDVSQRLTVGLKNVSLDDLLKYQTEFYQDMAAKGNIKCCLLQLKALRDRLEVDGFDAAQFSHVTPSHLDDLWHSIESQIESHGGDLSNVIDSVHQIDVLRLEYALRAEEVTSLMSRAGAPLQDSLSHAELAGSIMEEYVLFEQNIESSIQGLTELQGRIKALVEVAGDSPCYSRLSSNPQQGLVAFLEGIEAGVSVVTPEIPFVPWTVDELQSLFGDLKAVAAVRKREANDLAAMAARAPSLKAEYERLANELSSWMELVSANIHDMITPQEPSQLGVGPDSIELLSATNREFDRFRAEQSSQVQVLKILEELANVLQSGSFESNSSLDLGLESLRARWSVLVALVSGRESAIQERYQEISIYEGLRDDFVSKMDRFRGFLDGIEVSVEAAALAESDIRSSVISLMSLKRRLVDANEDASALVRAHSWLVTKRMPPKDQQALRMQLFDLFRRWDFLSSRVRDLLAEKTAAERLQAHHEKCRLRFSSLAFEFDSFVSDMKARLITTDADAAYSFQEMNDVLFNVGEQHTMLLEMHSFSQYLSEAQREKLDSLQARWDEFSKLLATKIQHSVSVDVVDSLHHLFCLHVRVIRVSIAGNTQRLSAVCVCSPCDCTDVLNRKRDDLYFIKNDLAEVEVMLSDLPSKASRLNAQGYSPSPHQMSFEEEASELQTQFVGLMESLEEQEEILLDLIDKRATIDALLHSFSAQKSEFNDLCTQAMEFFAVIPAVTEVDEVDAILEESRRFSTILVEESADELLTLSSLCESMQDISNQLSMLCSADNPVSVVKIIKQKFESVQSLENRFREAMFSVRQTFSARGQLATRAEGNVQLLETWIASLEDLSGRFASETLTSLEQIQLWRLYVSHVAGELNFYDPVLSDLLAQVGVLEPEEEADNPSLTSLTARVGSLRDRFVSIRTVFSKIAEEVDPAAARVGALEDCVVVASKGRKLVDSAGEILASQLSHVPIRHVPNGKGLLEKGKNVLKVYHDRLQQLLRQYHDCVGRRNAEIQHLSQEAQNTYLERVSQDFLSGEFERRAETVLKQLGDRIVAVATYVEYFDEIESARSSFCSRSSALQKRIACDIDDLLLVPYHVDSWEELAKCESKIRQFTEQKTLYDTELRAVSEDHERLGGMCSTLLFPGVTLSTLETGAQLLDTLINQWSDRVALFRVQLGTVEDLQKELATGINTISYWVQKADTDLAAIQPCRSMQDAHEAVNELNRLLREETEQGQALCSLVSLETRLVSLGRRDNPFVNVSIRGVEDAMADWRVQARNLASRLQNEIFNLKSVEELERELSDRVSGPLSASERSTSSSILGRTPSIPGLGGLDDSQVLAAAVHGVAREFGVRALERELRSYQDLRRQEESNLAKVRSLVLRLSSSVHRGDGLSSEAEDIRQRVLAAEERFDGLERTIAEASERLECAKNDLAEVKDLWHEYDDYYDRMSTWLAEERKRLITVIVEDNLSQCVKEFDEFKTVKCVEVSPLIENLERLSKQLEIKGERGFGELDYLLRQYSSLNRLAEHRESALKAATEKQSNVDRLLVDHETLSSELKACLLSVQGRISSTQSRVEGVRRLAPSRSLVGDLEGQAEALISCSDELSGLADRWSRLFVIESQIFEFGGPKALHKVRRGCRQLFDEEMALLDSTTDVFDLAWAELVRLGGIAGLAEEYRLLSTHLVDWIKEQDASFEEIALNLREQSLDVSIQDGEPGQYSLFVKTIFEEQEFLHRLHDCRIDQGAILSRLQQLYAQLRSFSLPELESDLLEMPEAPRLLSESSLGDSSASVLWSSRHSSIGSDSTLLSLHEVLPIPISAVSDSPSSVSSEGIAHHAGGSHAIVSPQFIQRLLEAVDLRAQERGNTVEAALARLEYITSLFSEYCDVVGKLTMWIGRELAALLFIECHDESLEELEAVRVSLQEVSRFRDRQDSAKASFDYCKTAVDISNEQLGADGENTKVLRRCFSSKFEFLAGDWAVLDDFTAAASRLLEQKLSASVEAGSVQQRYSSGAGGLRKYCVDLSEKLTILQNHAGLEDAFRNGSLHSESLSGNHSQIESDLINLENMYYSLSQLVGPDAIDDTISISVLRKRFDEVSALFAGFDSALRAFEVDRELQRRDEYVVTQILDLLLPFLKRSISELQSVSDRDIIQSDVLFRDTVMRVFLVRSGFRLYERQLLLLKGTRARYGDHPRSEVLPFSLARVQKLESRCEELFSILDVLSHKISVSCEIRARNGSLEGRYLGLFQRISKIIDLTEDRLVEDTTDNQSVLAPQREKCIQLFEELSELRDSLLHERQLDASENDGLTEGFVPLLVLKKLVVLNVEETSKFDDLECRWAVVEERRVAHQNSLGQSHVTLGQVGQLQKELVGGARKTSRELNHRFVVLSGMCCGVLPSRLVDAERALEEGKASYDAISEDMEPLRDLQRRLVEMGHPDPEVPSLMLEIVDELRAELHAVIEAGTIAVNRCRDLVSAAKDGRQRYRGLALSFNAELNGLHDEAEAVEEQILALEEQRVREFEECSKGLLEPSVSDDDGFGAQVTGMSQIMSALGLASLGAQGSPGGAFEDPTGSRGVGSVSDFVDELKQKIATSEAKFIELSVCAGQLLDAHVDISLGSPEPGQSPVSSSLSLDSLGSRWRDLCVEVNTLSTRCQHSVDERRVTAGICSSLIAWNAELVRFIDDAMEFVVSFPACRLLRQGAFLGELYRAHQIRLIFQRRLDHYNVVLQMFRQYAQKTGIPSHVDAAARLYTKWDELVKTVGSHLPPPDQIQTRLSRVITYRSSTVSQSAAVAAVSGFCKRYSLILDNFEIISEAENSVSEFEAVCFALSVVDQIRRSSLAEFVGILEETESPNRTLEFSEESLVSTFGKLRDFDSRLQQMTHVLSSKLDTVTLSQNLLVDYEQEAFCLCCWIAAGKQFLLGDLPHSALHVIAHRRIASEFEATKVQNDEVLVSLEDLVARGCSSPRCDRLELTTLRDEFQVLPELLDRRKQDISRLLVEHHDNQSKYRLNNFLLVIARDVFDHFSCLPHMLVALGVRDVDYLRQIGVENPQELAIRPEFEGLLVTAGLRVISEDVNLIAGWFRSLTDSPDTLTKSTLFSALFVSLGKEAMDDLLSSVKVRRGGISFVQLTSSLFQ